MSEFREDYERYAAMDPAIREIEAKVRRIAAGDGDRLDEWYIVAKPLIVRVVGWHRPVPTAPDVERVCSPDSLNLFKLSDLADAWSRQGKANEAALARIPRDAAERHRELATEDAYRAVYFYLLDVLYGAE